MSPRNGGNAVRVSILCCLCLRVCLSLYRVLFYLFMWNGWRSSSSLLQKFAKGFKFVAIREIWSKKAKGKLVVFSQYFPIKPLCEFLTFPLRTTCPLRLIIFYFFIKFWNKSGLSVVLFNRRDRGSTVVKALCYKSEGRWFDSRWCHWNFSLT